jgi:hypothetical protein
MMMESQTKSSNDKTTRWTKLIFKIEGTKLHVLKIRAKNEVSLLFLNTKN